MDGYGPESSRPIGDHDESRLDECCRRPTSFHTAGARSIGAGQCLAQHAAQLFRHFPGIGITFQHVRLDQHDDFFTGLHGFLASEEETDPGNVLQERHASVGVRYVVPNQPPISTDPPLFNVSDVSSDVLEISGALIPPPLALPPPPEEPPLSLNSWLTVRSTRLSE